jgi:hypothetical protein
MRQEEVSASPDRVSSATTLSPHTVGRESHHPNQCPSACQATSGCSLLRQHLAAAAVNRHGGSTDSRQARIDNGQGKELG